MKLTTVSTYPISVLSSLVDSTMIRCDKRFNKYAVRINSLRYHVFAESAVCCACGIQGTLMCLEYNPSDKLCKTKRAHFNLYAIKDGKRVLMTKDHIFPKSLGGTDDLSNLRTMCFPCNFAKGTKVE